MTEEYQLEEDDFFEEKQKTESITGNKILDIKLKYNYTPEEIEILKYNVLGEGQSWEEKLKNPELNEFIKWRRLKGRNKN